MSSVWKGLPLWMKVVTAPLIMAAAVIAFFMACGTLRSVKAITDEMLQMASEKVSKNT